MSPMAIAPAAPRLALHHGTWYRVLAYGRVHEGLRFDLTTQTFRHGKARIPLADVERVAERFRTATGRRLPAGGERFYGMDAVYVPARHERARRVA